MESAGSLKWFMVFLDDDDGSRIYVVQKNGKTTGRWANIGLGERQFYDALKEQQKMEVGHDR
jgi:hypothetical protein